MTPPYPLDVTAIVISYNSGDRVAETVGALESALADREAEILVLDNASADDTVVIARRAITRGRVIANGDNLGYGKAANIGLAAARGRRVLVMNDDARIDAASLDELIEVLDSDPAIAIVGPRIVDPTGNPMPSARRRFPGPRDEMARLRFAGKARANVAYPFHDGPVDVKWLVGACLLGKTDLLVEAGGFNEAFFLYGEDIDLCRRLSGLGYRLVTVPDATSVHVGGVATGQQHDSRARILRQISGRSVYYRIWYPRFVRSLIYLARAFGLRGQPLRLQTLLPMAWNDGPSLEGQRFPPPLTRVDDQSG